MKRVGCLGGTFDPIHTGHLELAKKVMSTFSLDEVWFLPTLQTPLKYRTLSPFSVRANLIKIAIKPYRKLKLCTIENELETPSYTIQTVKSLQKKYPNHQFSWIVGDDQVAQFDKWKDIDVLMKLVQFIVVQRSKLEIKDERLWLVSDFNHPASSTRVRKGYFLDCPPGVRNYILKNEIYLKEIVNEHCSEKRANHVFSMTNVCEELAKIHHVSEHQARMAGMLHDITKESNVEETLKIIKHHYPEMQSIAPAIQHCFTAVRWIKENMHYYDNQVCNAILNHTLGCGKSKLAMIVFIADKIDPIRGYDSSYLFTLARQDLKKAVLKVLEERNAYLNKEGIHVETI